MADEPEETTPVIPNRRAAIVALTGIVAVVALLVGLRLVGGSDGNQATPPPTPAARNDAGALPGLISTVPDSVLSAVGAGTASPLKARRLPALSKDGLPLVLFVAAEWCSDCAAERWALVAALGRFGTFENVKLTTSASTSNFPNTATFSFHGARYRSKYLAFDAVELQDRRHRLLQQMTDDQRQVFQRYDTKALTGKQTGALPFLDIGGRFVLSGAQFDPGVVSDQDARDIASAVQRPASDQALGVLGAANHLTAAICSLTGDQPAATCKLPIIQRLEQAQTRGGA